MRVVKTILIFHITSPQLSLTSDEDVSLYVRAECKLRGLLWHGGDNTKEVNENKKFF